MIQFDDHIFEMGWFNHQLVVCLFKTKTSRKRQNFLPHTATEKHAKRLFRNTDRQRALPHPSLCGSARKPIALTVLMQGQSQPTHRTIGSMGLV